jgi:hypothetical protein
MKLERFDRPYQRVQGYLQAIYILYLSGSTRQGVNPVRYAATPGYTSDDKLADEPLVGFVDQFGTVDQSARNGESDKQPHGQ